uniref:copine-2-like n=1 Tax=Myxine glutinosa TaxID=7769 RepID=UPI00358F4648
MEGLPGGRRVFLTVSCRNLLDRDLLSKSDPFCVLYLHNGTHWVEECRTEVLRNTLFPLFARRLPVEYHFEEAQQLRFAIFDHGEPGTGHSAHDLIGELCSTLGQIVSSRIITKPLQTIDGRPAGRSTITITAEKITDNRRVTLSLAAHHLDKMDLFGKSDPYLELYKEAGHSKWVLVHRTEVVKSSLDPVWEAFTIPLQLLCNGDMNKPIKGICYDWDKRGSPDLIGEFVTNLEQISQASGGHQVEFECLNPKKKQRRIRHRNSGVVVCQCCKIEREYSFLDYIFGGCQLHFTVGIDFTASNGDPQDPGSLHHLSPNGTNDYLEALRAVGHIIQDYDADKLFPALGFGARLPPDWKVSHDFALNFNPVNPYCEGIEGIVEAYRFSLQNVRLCGPTNFAPIINRVGELALEASEEPTASAYFVLLLLTDGVLADAGPTRTAVVRAARLPLSIIVVGLGAADFSTMEELDGDEDGLTAPGGERASRDIVQFVPFRNFYNAPKAELAKSLLAELPEQVVSYFRQRNLAPHLTSGLQHNTAT